MAPSTQRASIFAGLAAALLLLEGAKATTLCGAPSNGACSSPGFCHYENYLDPATSKPVEKCLSCPNGSSIAWTGKDSSPTPECIYSNVKLGGACDPSFIAYTHSKSTTTAACYDQCKTTDNIAYGADGNPIGCKVPKKGNRRLSGVVECAAPASGACADPDNCHYENFLDAETGEAVEKCLSCPNGSSIAWTGENSSPAPECVYSNVEWGAACDPSFIAYTHSKSTTTAACYDQCKTTDNIAYGTDGNPTGCKSGRRLRR